MHYIISLCIFLVVVGIGYVAAAMAYGVGFKDGHRDGYMDGFKAAEKELSPPF